MILGGKRIRRYRYSEGAPGVDAVFDQRLFEVVLALRNDLSCNKPHCNRFSGSVTIFLVGPKVM